MVKLKWKKTKVKMVTPLKKHHDVKGYAHGELAVHRIPDTKPQIWGITHIKTGMNVTHGLRITFPRMADVKEFARQLLSFDSWYIENSAWGDLSKSNPDRIKSLYQVLRVVLTTNGYKSDTRVFSKHDNPKPVWVCECGKMSHRYMVSSAKEKWGHFCLECQPHDNKRKEV